VQIIGASLFLQVFGLILPLITKVVIDQIIPLGLSAVLPMLGIGLLVLLLAQLVTTLLRASLLTYLQARMDASISSGFFEHMLKLSLRFFQVRSTGDILNRVSSNTIVRDLVGTQLVSTWLDGSLVIVYMFILLSQSQVFGVAVFLTGLLQVGLLLVTRRPVRMLTSRELDAGGKSQGYVAEMLTGIETLKAAGAEQRAFQQWSNLYFNQLNISVRRNYFTAAITTLVGTLSALAPLLLLWIGVSQVLSGSMELGTMFALNALAGAFLTPLSSLVKSGQQLQTVNSHLQRISDVISAEPEQDIQCVQLPPRLTGRISLEHVSFQYDPQTPRVLDDIVLDILPGQKVALVGQTGSGKSTLGKLLLGLCPPTSGEIRYDDIPLQTLDYQALRSQFGSVMQDAHIFSGSIRQNITFNNPDIDMEHTIRAAQLAALHQDILQWPMGYETFVSEGGNALSGGQRQRLAIARALAHEPALLLLDEATSALDVVTERIVEQNLNQLACTQILIAHRLSTIKNADLILVLDQGKIVERGSHQQLLEKKGYYARLIHNQLVSGDASAGDPTSVRK
jgi:ABC-type bacteriocin/lantibiotic exporter with double-glycine peptidase domain